MSLTSLRAASARLAAPLALLTLATSLSAQAPAQVPAQAPAQAPPQAVPTAIPTPAQQIASAVAPLPADLRAGAAVLGYRRVGTLESLRAGTNGMICLADVPADTSFHVACYHDSLEPFMARGRSLRTEGVTGERVDSARFREVREGKLAMPKLPAMLYSLTGTLRNWDMATGALTGMRPLAVVYIPFATAATTGLSTVPVQGAPWLMFPGTPKAHIMLVGTMR